ncbi:pyridoxal-phosphate dependent enzyme [Psychromarinibacter sp. C21-152]|uniref:Pyridoxal-phosphate dependent enzyme n=1 Tax=Psychromarinibacter sediminicola TaxID=3033385 RepID=A0AAE3T9W5_9RHOB|nr:pyridoxal-phosphate dependent enzyme [Psychromarinibacter sediminicola]MDF0603065.1 pyridoxal-phosphate dependent enzyme [Psychromarinibacter sediminicola]
MPDFLSNPHRGTGLPVSDVMPADDATPVTELLRVCPLHAATPLLRLPELAAQCGVGQLFVKDERGRMGLGSFKALGAAHAIARDAERVQGGDWGQKLSGRTYVAASAGNHGLSVAAGARVFGARSVIYLADTVPEAFARRLRAKGAEVVRAGDSYAESMAAAERDAAAEGWTLLSDSSWPGYTELPWRVMEGYLQMSAEIEAQISAPPTHILLQAGVGGLAAAVAAHARRLWGDGPQIVVVEPEAAPALAASLRAGRIVTAEGPVSAMGRLDCKTPSMIALAGLSRDADLFATISEQEAAQAVAVLAGFTLDTTPSGAAGLAALLAGLPGAGEEARVLAILSEGPEGD